MSAVVSEKEHDGGIDSGVCPSPDESYQNYDEAFPPLSSSPENNNDLSAVFSSSPSWQFAKRSATTSNTMTSTTATTDRYSSSPLLNTTSTGHYGGNFDNVQFQSVSNFSPTSVGATPNKRPKLHGTMFDTSMIRHHHNFNNDNSNGLSGGGGYDACNSNHAHQHFEADDRRCQRRSCPDLLTQKFCCSKSQAIPDAAAAVNFANSFAANNYLSSFSNNLKIGGGGTANETCCVMNNRPEFCCPIVNGAGNVGFGLVGINHAHHNGGSGPAAFGSKASSRSSPQFVVPKCFKVGSWPTKSENCSKHANDVPFWSCSEWFCTMHKGVEIGLLSAKVNSDAAKNLAPNVTVAASTCTKMDRRAFSGSSGQTKHLAPNNNHEIIHEIGGEPVEHNLIDLNWESGDDVQMADDNSARDTNNNNNDKQTQVGVPNFLMASPPPTTTVAGPDFRVGSPPADPEEFDAPQFILQLIENECDEHDGKAGAVKRDNFYNVNMNNQQAVITNLDLDTYWPTIADQSNVPEFKYFPYDNTMDGQDHQQQQPQKHLQQSCPNSIYFSPIQEVGFCLPKFDLSTCQQQQQATVNTGNGNGNTVSVNYPSPFSKVVRNKTKQKCHEPHQYQPNHQLPLLQPLIIPPDLGQNQGGKAQAQSQTQTTATAATVTVPISPDTHFVPIRSESMEDAYYPKPGFDEPPPFQTYLDETDYYVYLEPQSKDKGAKNNIQVNFKKSVATDPIAKPVYTTSFQQQQQFPQIVNKRNSKGFTTTIKSSASLFHSLPLKFRASKPEKMVQTEEKYFVYCYDGGGLLDSLDERGQNDITMGSQNFDDFGYQQRGRDGFSTADHDYDSSSSPKLIVGGSGKDFGGGSNVIGQQNQQDQWRQRHQLMEAEFEIWACKSLPISDSLYSTGSCWSSSDFSDSSRPTNNNNNENNNFNNMINNNNIFVSVVENSYKSSSDSFSTKLAADFANKNDLPLSSCSSSFFNCPTNQQQQMGSLSSANDIPSTKFAAASSHDISSSSSSDLKNTGTAKNIGAEKITADTKQLLEMWQKQDEKDEDLLLHYVSSISLISPLETTTTTTSSSLDEDEEVEDHQPPKQQQQSQQQVQQYSSSDRRCIPPPPATNEFYA